MVTCRETAHIIRRVFADMQPSVVVNVTIRVDQHSDAYPTRVDVILCDICDYSIYKRIT